MIAHGGTSGGCDFVPSTNCYRGLAEALVEASQMHTLEPLDPTDRCAWATQLALESLD